MKSARQMGPVAIVAANATLNLVVQELSVAGEWSLSRQLQARAKKALGPEGLFANIKPHLDAIKDEVFKRELMRTTANMMAAGDGVSSELVEAYRCSPDGVAFELYARSRVANSDVAEKDIRLLINDANAMEVRLALVEALNPDETDAKNG